eukprot:CAMPEP_0202383694 /NCGR_PEP_ID=MMETSP1127-20130417/50705_1 /ASSEMBLY_ACC=CAM_ASM_000462 /TAXON_ID=3047 /ORGANISM="Dunaliella tertiolecta, Strain CCMP1320" /LENGTH=64 /DNA_ID=CAMNT_0048983261 /DNA_START=280 /DNA_END=470 /DNA_ORIENTATION=+
MDAAATASAAAVAFISRRTSTPVFRSPFPALKYPSGGLKDSPIASACKSLPSPKTVRVSLSPIP